MNYPPKIARLVIYLTPHPATQCLPMSAYIDLNPAFLAAWNTHISTESAMLTFCRLWTYLIS